jgi:uncharacterized integral membrane protein (TIGR00697 family)
VLKGGRIYSAPLIIIKQKCLEFAKILACYERAFIFSAHCYRRDLRLACHQAWQGGAHLLDRAAAASGKPLCVNLLQEYYGKESAKKCVWLSFCALLFFVAMSLVHLIYQPSPHDVAQASYAHILGTSPRLVAASIFSFIAVQWFDLRLFGYLKAKTRLPLFIRNCLSLTASQFIDTLLFSYLGLWGHVESLFDVFLISFLIKVTIALVLSASSLKKQSYAPVPI